MKLIRTSILSGVASLIKIVTLLSINKVLAIYTGPSGYALVGQLQNAVQIFSTFASGAVNTGVTKYTAEYGRDFAFQRRLWQTAITVSGLGSFLSAIFIFLFSEEFSIFFLGSPDYKDVFRVFAVALTPTVLNSLLLAILNGKKEIEKYILANIVGSVFSFVFTVALAYFFNFFGALIALVSYQSISFLFTFRACLKSSWFGLEIFRFSAEWSIVKKLVSYTLMALSSAVCVPLTALLIRSYLNKTLGADAAGYWEAMSRLSSAYMMVVTMTLSVYYLPRLSELVSKKDIKAEVVFGYKVILPVAGLLSFGVFLFRDFIIGILFSEDFSPMRSLFAWQLLGDTLKIGSWILSYLMVSRAMIKEFIVSEILFSITYFGLVIAFSSVYGLIGTAFGYCLNYLLYWMFLYFFVWRKI